MNSFKNVKKGYDEYRRPGLFVSKPTGILSEKTSGVTEKPYPAYFYERLKSKLNIKYEEATGEEETSEQTSLSDIF